MVLSGPPPAPLTTRVSRTTGSRGTRGIRRATFWGVVLSPPPLRGRVRVGGDGFTPFGSARSGRMLLTPHPSPPPQGGREQEGPDLPSNHGGDGLIDPALERPSLGSPALLGEQPA